MQTSADDGNGKLESLMYIDKTAFKTSPKIKNRQLAIDFSYTLMLVTDCPATAYSHLHMVNMFTYKYLQLIQTNNVGNLYYTLSSVEKSNN